MPAAAVLCWSLPPRPRLRPSPRLLPMFTSKTTDVSDSFLCALLFGIDNVVGIEDIDLYRDSQPPPISSPATAPVTVVAAADSMRMVP